MVSFPNNQSYINRKKSHFLTSFKEVRNQAVTTEVYSYKMCEGYWTYPVLQNTVQFNVVIFTATTNPEMIVLASKVFLSISISLVKRR